MQTLTEKDIEVITKIVESHKPVCQIGLTQEDVFDLKANRFTPDEVNRLKKCVKALDRSATAIGYVLVTAVATGMIVIFTKGFWVGLLEGIKNAPVK